MGQGNAHLLPPGSNTDMYSGNVPKSSFSADKPKLLAPYRALPGILLAGFSVQGTSRSDRKIFALGMLYVTLHSTQPK